ncbi:cornifelin isoform X2 [Vombatus ursinus]|uniref:cornifelin isoform X2 n=1 Tax=Vombatus ursinus TaxID=29139 RepID=UPI000FFDAE6C|nr:cornifelin isoform X2 [Vombatus ursinus]
MSFYEMSHFSFFSREVGSSRDLHSLDTSYNPKPCHLEPYPFQEPIVGKQPPPVSSQALDVFYRSLPRSPHLPATNDWNRALFDFRCTNLCVNGALLPCLLACFVADTQGECCCLPYLPGALVAMRTSLRVTQGIQGSIAEDWLVMCCCPVCGLCQMAHQYNSSVI